jgi:hypothetical protein
MKKVTKFLPFFAVVFLTACGKPFPIEDELYAEYKVIACKIPSGRVTPKDLKRQAELNKIFEEKISNNGKPDANWLLTHSEKLQNVLDLSTCT